MEMITRFKRETNIQSKNQFQPLRAKDERKKRRKQILGGKMIFVKIWIL